MYHVTDWMATPGFISMFPFLIPALFSHYKCYMRRTTCDSSLDKIAIHDRLIHIVPYNAIPQLFSYPLAYLNLYIIWFLVCC